MLGACRIPPGFFGKAVHFKGQAVNSTGCVLAVLMASTADRRLTTFPAYRGDITCASPERRGGGARAAGCAVPTRRDLVLVLTLRGRLCSCVYPIGDSVHSAGYVWRYVLSGRDNSYARGLHLNWTEKAAAEPRTQNTTSS